MEQGNEGRKGMTSKGQQEERRIFLLPLTLSDCPDTVFCLFSQNQVVEILGERPIQQIPFSPRYLKGVILYFDRLTPVICLDTLCNRKTAGDSNGYRQLVVIRTGVVDPDTGEPLKAVVLAKTRVIMEKKVNETYTTSFVEREAPSSLRSTGVLRGYYQRQEQSLALIDLSPLLLGAPGKAVLTQ